MLTHNTISRIIKSLLVIIVLFVFSKIDQSIFAQDTYIPDDAAAAKNHQIGFQNNTAPAIPNSNLSISGIANFGFENGAEDWIEFSSHGWDLIVNSGFPSPVTPHTGQWAVWMGGDIDETSYIQQQITVPDGVTSLSYYHWIASADECGYDKAMININSVTIEEINLCSTINTGGWAEHTVDISAYAGQSVTLQIRVETDSSNNSNYFIDDLDLGLTQVYLPLLIKP